MPLFTVIIPTHNRPELLQRTLQSLISQTFTDFQVVIVDDAGSYLPPYKELLALQGRYIHIIRSGIPGPAISRNMGLAVSDSQYAMFLDDDDTIEPEHLQTLARHISKSSPEIVYCDFKVLYEDRSQMPPTPSNSVDISLADVTKDSVFIRNQIPNSCLVYRHDIANAHTHNADMLIYEDWDFLLACLKDHELIHIPINSVTIHKTQADKPENLRRGNTRDDKVVEVMLELYQKHAAPNIEVRLARKTLLTNAGYPVDIESC